MADQLGARFLRINLIGLFAVALWLRVTSLEAIPEACGDETWYGVQAAKLLRGEPFAHYTFSGNPDNPFYFGPVVALTALFRPSAWIVRLPAVVSGVLAVILTWGLGRRVLDRTTAWIAATLLAVLPVAIVFSRIGLDGSQLPLCGLLCLYYAFAGKGIGLLLATLAGLIVHPTSVFLLPASLGVFLVRVIERTQGDPVSRRRWLMTTAVIAAVGCVAWGWITFRRPFVRAYFQQHFQDQDWGAFLASFDRFFLGLALPPHEPHLQHGWLPPVSGESRGWQGGLFWAC
ncbi:MAG: glycosyltransferase family 39 protein, partial [Isosphaeraceae bacterium]|nr:glycosyltransferase family 39 protein [Isosphaeraceae bacterium]